MRITCLVVFLFGLTFLGNAQDIIILQTGEEIECLVKEVGIDEIKYVKYNNQNGPSYVKRKSSVFMIKYENGTKDIFNAPTVPVDPFENQNTVMPDREELKVQPGFFRLKYFEGANRINKSEFFNLLKSDNEAYALYSDHTVNKITHRAFSGVSWIATIFTITNYIYGNDRRALIMAVTGLVTGTIARIFRKRADTKLKLAIRVYNQNLRQPQLP